MRQFALLWLVGSSLACVRQPPPPKLVGPEPASFARLSALTLPRYPDGSKWKLADERGSVVLLDVWATWCQPCRESMPLYQDLNKQYGSKGLKVYAINVDADSHEIPVFLKETQTTLPVLLDPNAVAAEDVLHVKLMPTSFLIDRAGTVREIHEGFSEEFLMKYVSEVEALLKEPAP